MQLLTAAEQATLSLIRAEHRPVVERLFDGYEDTLAKAISQDIALGGILTSTVRPSKIPVKFAARQARDIEAISFHIKHFISKWMMTSGLIGAYEKKSFSQRALDEARVFAHAAYLLNVEAGKPANKDIQLAVQLAIMRNLYGKIELSASHAVTGKAQRAKDITVIVEAGGWALVHLVHKCMADALVHHQGPASRYTFDPAEVPEQLAKARSAAMSLFF